MSDQQVIEFKRGDTFLYTYEIVTDDQNEDPYPLTDLVFRSQIRNSSGKVVANMTDEPGGGLTVDVDAGTVTAKVLPEVTRTFLVQKHYTDLEMTFPDGFVRSTDTVIIKVEKDQTVAAE